MTSLSGQREKLTQGPRAWVWHTAIPLPLLCLIILGIVPGAVLLSGGRIASAASYAVIKGQVPTLVQKSSLLRPAEASLPLSLSVGLQLRNAEMLKQYVERMTAPESVRMHQLTPAEITSAYAPLASSQQAVIDYLQRYGFRATTTETRHLVIGFDGTVGEAERAFHVQINTYRSPGGSDFYAPASDPAVPASLVALIQDIAGLDNSTRLAHPPIHRSRDEAASAIKIDARTDCPTPGANYFTPTQLSAAYNLNSFYRHGFEGEGQVVALLELDDYRQTDISRYVACYGGGSVPVKRILVDGGPGAPSDGGAEVELDMELVLSAAPKLAGLEVYEAANDTWAHYIDLWSEIINDDSASVISTSWGSCEAGVPVANRQEENELFMLAQAQGQTIFAASGDDGSNDCEADPPARAVDDPASQPYVTGVGGTSLILKAGGYGSERVWKDKSGAGGGGVSSAWPMPVWQSAPGVHSGLSSGTVCAVKKGNCREVPDVSLDADPNTGYLVFCGIQTACQSNGAWLDFGGTSAAAPMWAAFTALTNEKILRDGGFNLGFLNPYLYQIARSRTMYARDFHDITVGNNDLVDGGVVYPATSAYDMASGLGSYNAWYLALDLERLAAVHNGTRGMPANTRWYFADGAVGGGFTERISLANPSVQPARVSVRYIFNNRTALTVSHLVGASAVAVVDVNAELKIPASARTRQAVSLSIASTNNVPIVAERPISFTYRDTPGGSNILGSTGTHTTFYFAQVDTSKTGTDTSFAQVIVLNPQSRRARISATFYSNGRIVDRQHLTLSALRSGTITTGYRGRAALVVTSDIGIIAEQSLYATIAHPAIQGKITGAAAITGATSLADDWLFAEGNTGKNVQEYLVLANFSPHTVLATVKLMYSNGSHQSIPLLVSGHSQFFFNVNGVFEKPARDCHCTPTPDVAAEVMTASASLVVDRLTYFHLNGLTGLTDVTGQPGPASSSIYSFAEGNGGDFSQEFLALANFGVSAVPVAITLFVNGSVMEQETTLPAHTRQEIDINSIIDPMVSAYAPHNPHVAIVVQSFKGPIVAERIVYFTSHSRQKGGTDIIGYTGN